MMVIYNIIALLLTPLFALALPIYLLVHPEKRKVISKRLGFGLELPARRKKATLWIHALSVGEVTSAHHLVQLFHRHHRESTTVIFSTTTLSGQQLAKRLIGPYCDALIYYPFDFLPVIKYFHRKIQPDLFILIETDFWPNMLNCLAGSKVPVLLFNGRISERSMRQYRRFSFFFAPLFDKFTMLCMQTGTDVKNMVRLGIAESKAITMGNLKFGSCKKAELESSRLDRIFPSQSIIVCAGSTHEGEEESILDAFLSAKKTTGESLHLILAPRKISRCDDLTELVKNQRLSVSLFSTADADCTDVTIVDTLGDLATLYRYADVSYIGGSLVDEGGHNPLEATRYGCPVLFGPHMDDFSEISRDLQQCGAALVVEDSTSLRDTLERLITDANVRKEMGERALHYSTSHNHVIADHLQLIHRYL